MKRLISGSIIVTFLIFLAACTPEIGSEEWCEQMKEKARGDWTVNEASNFAKHCLF